MCFPSSSTAPLKGDVSISVIGLAAMDIMSLIIGCKKPLRIFALKASCMAY